MQAGISAKELRKYKFIKLNESNVIKNSVVHFTEQTTLLIVRGDKPSQNGRFSNLKVSTDWSRLNKKLAAKVRSRILNEEIS